MKKKLGRYEILEVLGRGSMGVVYKGLDPGIGKIVAIKTMNQKITEKPEMQERFYREGTLLGQIQHKNIVNVYTVGVDGITCYIAMEYLEGISLEKRLKQVDELTTRQALDIIHQVCEGLGAAHRQKIVHRDIKPANIFLLNEDHVKVLDFGVAHFQNSQLTGSGVLLGTINYMAPEQITGDKMDHRADIFSVGVIMYELLAGHNPFIGQNLSQTLVKIVNDIPAPLPGLPAKLIAILNKALAKRREQRYESITEMSAALREVLRSDEVEAYDRHSPKALARQELKKSQDQLLRKMIDDRVTRIRKFIQRNELEDAEALISQLGSLNADPDAVARLTSQLARARTLQKEKAHFAEQLNHETLAKAHEQMADRHYVRAVELCNKVLKLDARNQDARVIKASSLKRLREFIRENSD